jgi:hypothetical protein
MQQTGILRNEVFALDAASQHKSPGQSGVFYWKKEKAKIGEQLLVKLLIFFIFAASLNPSHAVSINGRTPDDPKGRA